MFTLITGTPGAAKTLHAVAEICRHVPGSTIEAQEPCVSHGVSYQKGDAIPRHLFSNIKELRLDHQVINADNLRNWHEWAQPGDVIVFDEVQEVARPRAMGTQVPEWIQKVEVHRHMGVDLVAITQDPMLMDSNLRRLVNRHLQIRRLTRTVTMVYEFDHCANAGQYGKALDSKIWMHPKECYRLYKSAQLHTKPTARLPRLVWLGVFALAALAWFGPTSYARITDRLQGKSSAAASEPGTAQGATSSAGKAGAPAAGLPAPSVPPDESPARPVIAAPSVPKPRPMGCIASATRCACFDADGALLALPEAACREGSERVGVLAATLAAPIKPEDSAAQDR